MAKGIKKILLWLIFAIFVMLLTTLGIDAADHAKNFSNSIIGSLFVNKKNQDPCPEGMVLISNSSGGFCLDIYENSPGEKCPIPVPVNQGDTLSNLSHKECIPISSKSNKPWTFVSQDQAKEACARTGKRLPSVEEWTQASLGTPDKESGWSNDDCQVASNWNNQPGGTGSALNCISSSGAYDMIGNVWEWIDGVIEDGKLDGKDLPDSGYIVSSDGKGLVSETRLDKPDPNYHNDYFWIKKQGVRAIAKGGYWDNQADAGSYSAYLVSPPSFAGTGVGFRCAK
jgi:formylglycine-generating enzyme required for sulfatase activity